MNTPTRPPYTEFIPVIGVAGLAIALQNNTLFGSVGIYGSAVLLGIATMLLLRGIVKIRRSLIPIQSTPSIEAFTATLPVSVSLLAIAYSGYVATSAVAYIVWVVASVLQLGVAGYSVHRWLTYVSSAKKSPTPEYSPSMLFPSIGLLLIPIIGVQYLPLALTWSIVLIGLGMTFIASVILISQPRAQRPLLPQNGIWLSASMVTGISLYSLSGSVLLLEAMTVGSLFILVLLLFHLKDLRTPLHFMWWGLVFPLASSSVALGMTYTTTHIVAYGMVGAGLTVVGVLLMMLLSLRTRLNLAIA